MHVATVLRAGAAALAVSLGLLAPAPTGAEAEWIHVRHRQFPLAFDVPAETSLQRLGVFTLARVHRDDGRKVEVDFFGIRSLPRGRSAVQFGFYWVTAHYRGVDAERLARLRRDIGRPEAAAGFLREVFLAELDVALDDRGRAFVDGHRGRRIALERTVARGTPDERRIQGDLYLVPVAADATLVAIARFDEEATPGERAGLFSRVIDSVEIGLAGSGSRQARLGGSLVR